LLIEVLQRYVVVHRSFEWADVIADALGSLTAVLVVHLIRRMPSSSEKQVDSI
jgi:VanZ family protein